MSSPRPDLEPPPPFALSRLPASARIGRGVRIFAHDVRFGDGVEIGDHAVIVADEVTIGDNATIGRDCEIRAAHIDIGARSELHRGAEILVAERFFTGEATRIASQVKIVCRDFRAGRLLYMGDGASVGYGGTFSSTATVSIGDRVTIGQHSILNANLPIEIGDDVGTGSYLALWTHGYHFGHGALDGAQVAYAPVRIGRNVWLGFQVTVLPGVSIGESTIVAAGSVVARDLPPQVLAGGVPAKVKKPLQLRPVPAAECHADVAAVLLAWCRELEWKGCRVSLVHQDESRVEIVAALGDGSEATRIALISAREPLPERRPTERLVIVTIDEREPAGPLSSSPVTRFSLRQGAMNGPSSPLVEDLRDHLRRHAMPCGDTHCFSSIEPKAFARLRRPGREPAANPADE